MYELSRVRLYSIGPAGARYADTVLDLRGVGEPVPDPAPTQAEFFEDEPVGPPRRPAPAGVLFLENGGGKSVLLKLIFSVMLPGPPQHPRRRQLRRAAQVPARRRLRACRAGVAAHAHR